MTPEQIELKMTCGACPEQYDAFVNDKLVGYLRLRHGYFSVTCPDVGGDVVFETGNVAGDGVFEDRERDHFLTYAKIAIASYHNKKEYE